MNGCKRAVFDSHWCETHQSDFSSDRVVCRGFMPEWAVDRRNAVIVSQLRAERGQAPGQFLDVADPRATRPVKFGWLD